MRVLGVDPGLTRCGVGVVDGAPGRALRMAAVGVIRTAADVGIGERLLLIEQGLERWLDEHQPEVVAVERVFSQHNVRTVMGTAQASAVAMLCATRRGLPVALYTPSEVKAAVTGSGRADKAQVGAMVTRLLRLEAPPKPADAADALALAICHIWRGAASGRLTAALAAAERPAQPGRAQPGRARSGGAQPSRSHPDAQLQPGTGSEPGVRSGPGNRPQPGAGVRPRGQGGGTAALAPGGPGPGSRLPPEPRR